jgi:tRNA-2-methylthio-N6-dimethylallyladenosine synthase
MAAMKNRDPRTFHVKSFGCQMNVYDGARMAELLEAEGLEAAADAGSADLVVLNTCHIREKAAEKVYSDIGRLMKRDDRAPAGTKQPMIAVAGCVAQAEGAEIPRRAPGVDIVVGPQAYHRLPELVAAARAGGRAIDTDMPLMSKFGALPGRRRQGPSAFLTVQEGCDKFCTYCVVPYTRGAEVSRGWDAIVAEAESLVEMGAREITLLGQNVNAWEEEGRGLDALIRTLAMIPGLARIRYTTSHPNDMTEGLIRAHKEVEKLMPYLHLPVQSGSDRVLKAMNRSHSAASYLAILDRVRAARPDIALSGDFIVGFPGESDAEFEETLRLVETVNYAQAYTFKYSPRPGTPAAEMDLQVPEAVKDERLQRLQALINAQQQRFNQASVGKRTKVLLERTGKRPGQLIGKSPWLQSVHLETSAAIGDIVEVELLSAGPNSLAGKAVMPAEAGISASPAETSGPETPAFGLRPKFILSAAAGGVEGLG